MGADMFLSTLWIRAGKEPNEGAGIALIEALTLEEVNASLAGDEFYALDDILGDAAAYNTSPLPAIKEFLKEALTDILGTLHRRDVTQLSALGWYIYATGGMSSGDLATEAQEHWDTLMQANLGWSVLEAVGFEIPPLGPEQYIVNEMEIG